MYDVLSGDEISFLIPCEVDGLEVEPTAAPTFTVYTVTGTPIPALTDVEADLVDATQALVIIPGTENTLSGSPETRFVRLTFEYNGRVFKVSRNYRILPFIPLTVTPEYISLNLLGGVGTTDPAAYDIYSAYLTAKRSVPTLDDHLAGEYSSEANHLVALYAARPHMSRISLSMTQREKSHDEEIERFRGIKFDELARSFDAEITALIALLNGDSDYTPFPAMVLTTPTDPVTGGG